VFYVEVVNARSLSVRLQSVDLGSISLLSQTKRLKKLVLTASLLDIKGIYIEENKSASSLVVSLDKVLNGMPLPFSG